MSEPKDIASFAAALPEIAEISEGRQRWTLHMIRRVIVGLDPKNVNELSATIALEWIELNRVLGPPT